MARLTSYTTAPHFSEKTYKHKRNALSFAVLGLFAKLLNIDLSKLHFYGIVLPPENTKLVPGFLGLALAYSLLMLIAYALLDLYRRKLERNEVLNPEFATDSAVAEFFPQYLKVYKKYPDESIAHASKKINDWINSGYQDDVLAEDVNLINEFRRARRTLNRVVTVRVKSELKNYKYFSLISHWFDFFTTIVISIYASLYLASDTRDVVEFFLRNPFPEFPSWQ